MRISDWSSDVCSSDLRRLEAQAVVRLQHQGGRKGLAREALVEVADEDLVDLVGADAGVLERLQGDASDEGFDIVVLVLAERRVAPADDAGGHADSPSRGAARACGKTRRRSEEHTSELQSLMRTSYAVFCL